MDRHTKKQRSFNMSQVKSKNTLPERIVFKALKNKKIKFGKHYPIVGKPDVVFRNEKVAIFIDGEFWHGRNFSKWKGSLSKFWYQKIKDNIKRDKISRDKLRSRGWKVIALWDKDIIRNPEKEIEKILVGLHS